MYIRLLNEIIGSTPRNEQQEAPHCNGKDDGGEENARRPETISTSSSSCWLGHRRSNIATEIESLDLTEDTTFHSAFVFSGYHKHGGQLNLTYGTLALDDGRIATGAQHQNRRRGGICSNDSESNVGWPSFLAYSVFTIIVTPCWAFHPKWNFISLNLSTVFCKQQWRV